VPRYDDAPALSGVITPAPDLWDALAKEYCSTTRNPSIEAFGLYWAYNRLMDVALGVAPPPAGTDLDLSREQDLKRALWVMHILGNWQSNWLWHNGHSKDVFGPPEDRSPTGGLNFFGAGDPDYRESAALLRRQIALATTGSDGDVLQFNLDSVRGAPLIRGTRGLGLYAVPPLVGLGDYFIFAYSIGYMHGATDLNKPAVDVPDWARIAYDPTHPQDATYGAGDAPFMAVARRSFQAAIGGDQGVEAHQRALTAVDGAQPSDSLASQFPVPYAAGTAVWGFVVKLRDYSKRQYYLLLHDGVFITQWLHANTLAGIGAYATRDAALGRQQVRANTFWRAWMYAYFRTIPNGKGDAAFPEFTFADTACRSHQIVTVRPRVPAGFQIRKVVVQVNGKVVNVRHGRVRSIKVNLKGQPPGKVRLVLRITGRTRAGSIRVIHDRRTYQLCRLR
jgi:hypothetical protein